jgi:hypothetical protein
VIQADEIYGSSYDIITKVTAQTEGKLKEIIRRIGGKVKATQTMMVVMTL